uniref:Uncharacterized protein n=1 Tax=Panagrolaimus sp. JU765 TaxID=591449 RepID=A0AC34R032_9BILA
MSDPIGKCQIFPEKKICLLYSSFSFGKDRFLKKYSSKKELAPKFAYRCVLHASNWTNGSDWEFLGSSEVVPLAIEENESHFSFVSPFEVKYDYDADTSLKFELQRARLAEKSGTELGPDCSIYVGAEMSNQDLNQTKSFNFHFSARQRFDENNVRLFSTEMAYRVLISRYFDRAEAFVPVFKSHVFGLSLKASLYQTQIVLELTHQNFAKIDGFFRFALIEAASEKCLCFGDLRGSPFFDQQVE